MKETNQLFLFDRNMEKEKNISYIAGFDEAGRGPLAGPVSTCGVVLPKDYENDKINDSKKLTDKERRKLALEIKAHALCYHIELVDVKTIDEINILEADRKGMEICLKEILKQVPVDFIITDYMKLHTDIPLLSIPKGDGTSQSVAAASILAKVARDDYMIQLDAKYPEYGFKKNKGYGTKAHIEAIKKYGFKKGVHRLTFDPIRSMIEEQLTLF